MSSTFLWLVSVVEATDRPCCSQGADVNMPDADVTDIESLKRRGHMEVAAGQVFLVASSY